MLVNNIKFALASLWSNKIRSALTMLGVIIGVFSVITLISIGEGVRQEFSTQISDIGSNLIIVIPGQIDAQSEGFNPASVIGISPLTVDDAAALKEIEHVNNLAWLMMISGMVSHEDKTSRSAMTVAGQPAIMELLNQELASGRFLTQEDLDQKNKVAVLTDLSKKALFGDEDALGQTIVIRQKEFEVVGVLKEKSNALAVGGMSFDDMVFLPFTTAEELTGQVSIFRMVVQADAPANVDLVKEKVKEVILAAHDGTEDFSVLTQDDLLGMFDTMFAILTRAITGIAAISLVVGGIGIMNIMLVSVTERTKEIGTRKALGATSLNILTQFITEAAILSCFGGAIGVGLSFIVGIIITYYIDLPTQITPSSLLLALAVSIAVGVIFGLMPAIKASRKSPIEALRYE